MGTPGDGDLYVENRLEVGSDVILPADSVDADDLNLVNRDFNWPAGSWLTDNVDCTDPAKVAAIGGAGGPTQWGVLCPMGSTDTDGFVYGSAIVPSGFDAASDIRFEVTAVVDTDSGAGTFHGSIGLQCIDDTETVGTTWGTEADLDVDEVAGDVRWDEIKVQSDALVDAAACSPGDTLYWRYKLCDSSGAASTNCTNSTATTITDLTLLHMRAIYKWDPENAAL